MKKLLIVLGGVFILLILVVGGGIAFVAVKGSALDKESKAYADGAIPAIVNGWQQSELERRLSPEFRSVTKDGDLEKLFGMFRKLGGLTSYNGVKGDAMMSATTQTGARITANYVGSAQFEAGPAQIELGLIKHGDQWQILKFRVSSRVFLDSP